MAYDFPNAPTVGQVYLGYVWDGEKWVSVSSPAAPNQSGVISIQVFTASGQYIPSANMTTCVIECVGGGGGGGGVVGAASTYYGGAGGGAGGYSRKVTTAAVIGISQSVTIGAGGTGNAGTAGGLGGDTSVGSLCIAKGGNGGGFTSNGVVMGVGGAGGPVGTGDVSIIGAPGGGGSYNNTANSIQTPAGNGGSSAFGGGAIGIAGIGAGTTATGKGAGGAGAYAANSATTQTGGAGAPGLVVITEYGMIALSPSTAQLGSVRYDLPQGLTSTQMSQGRANIAAPLRGWIAGLTLSTAGSSATFGIAVGSAADSTVSDLMQLASAYTKTTAAWAVGTGAGALDTGAIAASNWYWVFLIKRPDTGVIDVVITKAVAATTPVPTLPANYTLYRYIGSMRTNASSQWTAFIQNGDQFRWMAASVQDAAAVNPGTAAVTRTLTVPTGVVVEVDIAIFCAPQTSTNLYILITSLAETDRAPSGTDMSFAVSPVNAQITLPVRGVLTNTSAQIRTRQNASGASDLFNIYTFGWIDTRGRNA